MSKIYAVVIATTLSLLGSAARTHATHPQPWWLLPSVQLEMNLTPEQVSQLDSIYRASLPQRRQLRRQLTILERRLRRQFVSGPFEDQHVRPLIEQVSALEKQRHSARTMMLIRLYRVLTPEQRRQLGALSKRLGTQSESPEPAVVARVR
jgi:Spy/CpxP family protein refolding chaperone